MESVTTVVMSDSCLFFSLVQTQFQTFVHVPPIGAHYYAVYVRECWVLQHNQFGTWHTLVQQPTSYDSVWLLTGMCEDASYFESFSEMIYIESHSKFAEEAVSGEEENIISESVCNLNSWQSVYKTISFVLLWNWALINLKYSIRFVRDVKNNSSIFRRQTHVVNIVQCKESIQYWTCNLIQ